MTYSTTSNNANFKRYHIVTYNRDIKYAFIDYLRERDFVLLSVSGYYFDERGREGYYIEFKIPANTDINKIDEHIDTLYNEFER